ncbi:MAG: 4Fe-4S dicluster domain-containing protein, partial [Syntrophobacteraceae bacterium]
KASDLLSNLGAAVLAHPSITVHNCAQVTGFEGQVGNFKLHVRKQSPGLNKTPGAHESPGAFAPFPGVLPAKVPEMAAEFTIETGVVVLATGFKPYEPRHGEYGFGEFEEVVTLPEFIRMLVENRSEGGILQLYGRSVKNIAMIHCVGSRHIPGIDEQDERGYLNEYCSRTCCSATLHAAQLVRENHPRTSVFEFYRDIRAYGRGQEDLYTKASRNRVIFFRFEPGNPPAVIRNNANGGSPLRVRVKDTLTFGEVIEVPADLVVLSVGMEPADVTDLVGMMKLPVGADRFLLEVHPKLRPVEISIGGILLAGTCQAPMDAGEACAAASAAAAKASALLARGDVELDPFVAEVNTEKCKGTGACIEACLKEGALAMAEIQIEGQTVLRAEVNPVLCMGCGACVAVCAENAIDLRGWTLKQYEAMVDMIVAA